MRIIHNIAQLQEVIAGTEGNLYLYGAGFQAKKFLGNMEDCCRLQREIAEIKAILVSRTEGNPKAIKNIPVIKCVRESFGDKDAIILTVDDRIKGEIAGWLSDCKAALFSLDFDIGYEDVYNSIRPFAEEFPGNTSGLNKPSGQTEERTVWTCWWQGEEAAPDIVKACLGSQRKYLPADVRHVVITKDNYAEYITVPEYVLEKFRDGRNLPAHLADFLRVSLLYKYGGIWLDATVLLLDVLPEECWNYSLYSWRADVNPVPFGAKNVWKTWFLASDKGNLLFYFVMEAFLYYFASYDKVAYYFAIDYFISIGSNLIEGVQKQFARIPYNNEGGDELCQHLHETYSEERFLGYCRGTFLQKLTWHGSGYCEGSVYGHILDGYMKK